MQILLKSVGKLTFEHMKNTSSHAYGTCCTFWVLKQKFNFNIITAQIKAYHNVFTNDPFSSPVVHFDMQPLKTCK